MFIDLIFKDKKTKRIKNIDDFIYNIDDIVNIQFINYSREDIILLRKNLI